MPVPAILATLGTLATDPVFGPLLAELGTGLVNKFLGIGDTLGPGEQANRQMLQAGQAALPDIRRAAQGLPTAGSNAIMRQVRREGTAMQQSMAASATRSGLAGGTPQGTTPFRAQSERIQGSQQEALAQLLGQHQQQAQGLLMGGLPGAIGQEQQFQKTATSTEMFVKGALGKLGRKYAENPNDELLNRMINWVKGNVPGIAESTGGGSNFAGQFKVPGLPQ